MGSDCRYSLIQYVLLVVVFVVFCGLQFILVWFITGETIGMRYFFTALVVGFAAVAILAWLFDTFYPEQEDDRESRERP